MKLAPLLYRPVTLSLTTHIGYARCLNAHSLTQMLASLWILAAAVTSAADAVGGEFPANILILERAFPANQSVELELLRARDRARHARMLQRLNGVANFSVGGISDLYSAGLYYTKVKLGSPPRVFNVMIDTGSDVLWVQCNSCTDCPHSSGLGFELSSFDVDSSTTASPVACSHPVCSYGARNMVTQCSAQSNQCVYSLHYGDGSETSGFYVSDTFYFDAVMGGSMVANSSAPIVFGCSIHQSGDLTKTYHATDGIFGLGQQGLSVVSQLSRQGITPKVFSHCLNGKGIGGGILVLGEILEPSIVYTPLIPSQSHYNLNLQSISVNGQILQIDPTALSTSGSQGTIIDSGTTLAYLMEEPYDLLVGAITSFVSQSATPEISQGRLCYLVPTNIAEIFPLVSLNFEGGASMVLKPDDYLIHPNDGDGAKWCIGFQKVQGGALPVLGDLFLKDKIFVYDLGHQRIGWTDYDCSLPVNVSLNYANEEILDQGLIIKSSSTRIVLQLLPTSSWGFLILSVLVIGFLDVLPQVAAVTLLH